MSILELVRLALSRLGASRLRAALTMLGVIIGVASVVALVAVGQGATRGITSRLQGLGTNLLTVNPGAQTTGLVRGARGSATTLTVDDAAAIARALPAWPRSRPRSTTQAVVVAEHRTTRRPRSSARPPTTSRSTTTSVWQGPVLTAARSTRACAWPSSAPPPPTTSGSRRPGSGRRSRSTACPYTVVGILQAKGGCRLRAARTTRSSSRSDRGQEVLHRRRHGPLGRRERRLGRRDDAATARSPGPLRDAPRPRRERHARTSRSSTRRSC